jgi:hypothetical protein
MRCRWYGWSILLVAGLGFAGLHFLPQHASEICSLETAWEPGVLPPIHAANLIHTYCGGCHTSGRAKVDFDGPIDHGELRRERATWEMALQKLHKGEMPPPQYPQLGTEERAFLIHWLEEQLAGLEPAETMQFRVRRLRQVEYRNSIRDLLGVDWQPPEGFPADEGGWDLFKDVPAIPADLLPHYESATDMILAATRIGSVGACLDPEAGSEAENARDLVKACARLAYRRPLTAEETAAVDSALEAATRGGLSPEQAVKAGLRIVLTSPQFLYRIERRCNPDGAAQQGPSEEAVLASRLSHWLWSSAPDETLVALAERHELHHDLVDQARRMLKDPRAHALVDDFAIPWLGLQDSAKMSPNVNPAVLTAMHQETEHFLAHIIQEDRSVLEMLDADYTFLNALLAEHYGIEGVHGEHMRRVSVHGTPRGGLVTHGSMLTMTSGELTSPVQRGKWVLATLLGTPPPAPPAGLLEAFSQRQSGAAAKSAREALERHRSNPSCANCHAQIDGLGLPLENFDAQGRWQTESHGRPVEPSAIMPNGKVIDGPIQLKAYLLEKQGLFLRCLTEKLLMHALGRKLTKNDGPALDAIVEQVRQNQYRFSSVVFAIVESEPFLRAWGEPNEP